MPVSAPSPQLPADSASALNGRARRPARGKHLFHYVGGPVVHVRISGLYGTFAEWARPTDGWLPELAGQVDADGSGADSGTDLRGPDLRSDRRRRRLRTWLLWPGPDLLRSDANPSSAWSGSPSLAGP